MIDAHHHLYARPHLRYLIDDYITDLRHAGLDMRASVYVQARAFYLKEGPEQFRVWGETEFAMEAAVRAAEMGFSGLCAGIVGAVDLTLGNKVHEVISGHLQRAGHTAEGGRFCGIRHVLAWDPDTSLLNPAYPTSEDLMERPEFLEGFGILADLGLSFDAWVLAPQLPRLVQLAERFPDVPIILDHCGGLVGIGAYSGRAVEIAKRWSSDMARLAQCGNVTVKFGGLGMALSGLAGVRAGQVEGPDELARLWKPWFDQIFETFGPERMMLESNAPADRALYSFEQGWQAFGLLLKPLDQKARNAVCRETAARVYRLPKIERWYERKER